MFKKLLLLLLVAAFIPMLAQQRAIIDNYGNITFVKGSMNDALSTAKMKLPSRAQSSDLNFAAKGTIDTLGYDDYYVTPGVNFGMAANDYLYQYFEASTEMSLLAVGFLPLEWNGSFGNGNATAEVKLVNSNWTTQQWRDAGTVLLGYYPAAGNQPTETTAFASDPLASGEWVDLTEGELSEPFGDDLWSADGIGATLALTDEVWAWQDLTVLFTPEVVGGDVFGVSVKNVSGYDPETYGTSNWSAFSDEEAPEVGAKFYGGGRLSDDDYGWWVRGGYTWDFLVVVDITGDPPPTIENVTNLSGTTLETSDREVSATITDINPSGGDAGVAAASLFYTVDDGATWTEVAMTNTGDVYSAIIPGQAPGTTVSYYVWAEDVNGNTSRWVEYTYFIFLPESDNLLVFNGLTYDGGYPTAYYFGKDDFTDYVPAAWDHDVWALGAVTAGLLDNYKNVFEITTSGPDNINSEVVRAWLEADGTRNYAVAGDEWLGSQTGWSDSNYVEGDFQYDILGIEADYNDIVASSADSSYVMPVEGSLLGGELFTLQGNIEGADSMLYHPNFEIEVTNWLDGADFLGDVFMKAIFDGTEYDIAASRVLDAGNKIAFFGYDPLSLNSTPTYYWFGFSASAPQVKTLEWWGIDVVTTVKKNEAVPTDFKLSQNYPNPFNPSTKIEFAVPSRKDVSLVVYDVLGREVMTLVNGVVEAGTYEVSFNASNLASGVYVYTLKTGDFVSTKKMMLLK